MKVFHTPLIGHETALRLVATATDIAEQKGLAIVSCVIDTSGRAKAKLSMDGAPAIADTLVEQKAHTALFGMESAAFGEAIEGDIKGLHSFSSLETLTLLPGGFPLFHEGKPVGAFAVGGALPEQDVEIAKMALAAIDSNDQQEDTAL